MLKKKRWTKIEFWRIPELMAYLEGDLCYETTDGVLLLRNGSIVKSIIKLNNAIKTQ